MTQAEKEYIMKHYADTPTRDIALTLGMTVDGVGHFARRLGLYRRKAYEPRNCSGCQLMCNGHCLYNAEADIARCKAMRYTSNRWPEMLDKAQIGRRDL